jgi:hypothetical protein
VCLPTNESKNSPLKLLRAQHPDVVETVAALLRESIDQYVVEVRRKDTGIEWKSLLAESLAFDS